MQLVPRVICYSLRVDTYADVIAALVRHSQPGKVDLVFIPSEKDVSQPSRGRAQHEFISRIHKRLVELSKEHPAYGLCSNVLIVPTEITREQIANVVTGASAIDVTGASKDMMIDLVATALMRSGPPVLAIKWLHQYKPDTSQRIGRDPYEYEDLTALPNAVALKRSYHAQSRLIVIMGVVVFVVAILAGLSNWIPWLAFTHSILSIISIAAGFASLWIAVKATK